MSCPTLPLFPCRKNHRRRTMQQPPGRRETENFTHRHAAGHPARRRPLHLSAANLKKILPTDQYAPGKMQKQTQGSRPKRTGMPARHCQTRTPQIKHILTNQPLKNHKNTPTIRTTTWSMFAPYLRPICSVLNPYTPKVIVC